MNDNLFSYICRKLSIKLSVAKYKIVVDAVQNETGVPLVIMQSKVRTQEVVFARMMLSFILKNVKTATETEIAKILKVDRTAVYHYLKQFDNEVKFNSNLNKCYQKVLKSMNDVKKKARPEDDFFMSNCDSRFGIVTLREFKFHHKRRWRFDFAIPELKIAIEKEGGLWVGGRHNRAAGFIADMEKYNTAASMGWIVLRATPQNINSDDFMQIVDDAVLLRRNNQVPI